MSGNPRIPNSERTFCDDRSLFVALYSRGNSTRQTNIGTSLPAHKTKVPEFVLKTSWFDYIVNGADLKWLLKVIARLQLLRLLIDFKNSRHFFNQWEANPKPITPFTRDISRAKSKLQVIAWNSDWVHFTFQSCCNWSEYLLCYRFFVSYLKTALKGGTKQIKTKTMGSN